MKNTKLVLIALAIVIILAGCGAEKDQNDKEYRRISAKEYASKMKAGWIGQMAGVGWGAPTEFKYLERIIPEDKVPQWKPEMINQFNQDDIYVEMTFIRTLELYGFDVSIRQAGIDFANSEYQLWHANKFGRDNLRKGIAPSDSSHPNFTKHADDIDYQIEADYSGLIAPGMPNISIELGDKFGRLMNYGDGMYAGQFVGAMYAEAFFETDIEKIIYAGLECIPRESQYYKMVTDVIGWYKENPNDWVKSWEKIEAKYHDNPDYRRWTCDPGEFNIDAKINGAYILMGMLYGRGDPDKTAVISMRCGQDSDCNPSNAMGILFTSMGMEKVPDRFRSALDPDGKFSHTPYTFPKLIEVCKKLARDAVIRSGGKIETNADGQEVFVIPVKKPVPGKLQKSWAPGPIANSKFTAEEMEKITESASLGMEEGLGKFAPGWKISNWGDSLEPGLHKELKGKKNVYVTHPALNKTPCVLSKDVVIPAGKTTKLKLNVSHHPNGNWELIVKADGKQLYKKIIGKDSVGKDGWLDIEVDLSEFAGRKIKLELINHANDWNHESAFWSEIRLDIK